MARNDSPKPGERPPGKPPGMAPEVFHNQVRLLVTARHTLQKASGVERVQLWLDEDARLCGTAYLLDWRDFDGLADALVEPGLTLDAPPETPTMPDGGERTDMAVDVRFSAKEAPSYG